MSKPSRRPTRAARSLPGAKVFDPRDAMIDVLKKDVLMLAALSKKQHDEITELINQIGEVNLRVRFVMEMFKYEKGSRVVGPDGAPVDVEVTSMYGLYMRDRERFLAALLRGVDDGQATGTHGEGQAAATGTGPAPGRPALALVP